MFFTYMKFLEYCKCHTGPTVLFHSWAYNISDPNRVLVQVNTVFLYSTAKLQYSFSRVATVREKQKFFKVREKSGNFEKSQEKSQFLSK